MYLACPGTTSFPAICGAAFQILVPTKNTIVVVFVWVGLNSDKVRLMKSSASELGLQDKNLKLLQERMNLSSPQRLPLGIPIKIAIIEK